MAGPGYFVGLGQAGGQATLAKVGTAGMAAVGRRGGEKTLERYGVEHFRRLSRLGSLKRWGTLPGGSEPD